jgi:HlyD family secretion protein
MKMLEMVSAAKRLSDSRQTEIPAAPVAPRAEPALPALVAIRPPIAKGRKALLLTLLVAIGAAAGGGYLLWQQSRNALPVGIVAANGRIEADQIDISAKFAGRISTLLVNEGDDVKAGQVVATMDTQDLETSLRRAEAQVLQAKRAIDEARATLTQQEAHLSLAQQQFDRTSYLVGQGTATRELLDQRRQQLDAATAAVQAATAHVAQAEHALEAAAQNVALYKVNIRDNMLIAPRDGRIQYRIANLGEVLSAGGKVFTMIDILSVYIDVYFPTLEAGKAKVGTEARIVLDAYPNMAIPAKVSFVAAQSQFTPKTVETKTERDRLMFRVRVRVDPALLQAHAASVRSGLPGIAYVRLDPKIDWPVWLAQVPGQ